MSQISVKKYLLQDITKINKQFFRDIILFDALNNSPIDFTYKNSKIDRIKIVTISLHNIFLLLYL
jgi:hypothetical protein